MRSKLSRPLIIIGMHRSGTSMIARHLNALGVYMGRDLTANAESVFFQGFNRRLLAAAGGNWAEVAPVIERMRHPEFVLHEGHRLREGLFSRHHLSAFFDRRRRLGLALGLDVGTWGWKDPRNSITLPIWISVFPRAKVLHVVRNGVDAAISLFRREKDRDPSHPEYSERCQSLHNCFRLWEEYVQTCWEHRALIPSDQHLEVRYEEVLRAPETELRAILAFVNHGASPRDLAKVAATVDRSRLDNDTYRDQYREEIIGLPYSPFMAQLGYS